MQRIVVHCDLIPLSARDLNHEEALEVVNRPFQHLMESPLRLPLRLWHPKVSFFFHIIDDWSLFVAIGEGIRACNDLRFRAYHLQNANLM
jgi:hypothetical protein